MLCEASRRESLRPAAGPLGARNGSIVNSRRLHASSVVGLSSHVASRGAHGHKRLATMAVPEPTVDKLEREKKINVITHADKQRPLFKCLFQSLAVFHWILMPSLCLCVFCLLWYVRCSPSTIPPLWFITIPYVIWSLWIDDAPSTGKRRSMWFRRLFLMRLMRNYFPITLERTVPLPADRPYLFGYHPHGIIGLGAVVSFGSEACGIAQKLPGIVPRVLTLASNFNMPLYREYLMLLGFGSVSRESCETLLSQGPGSAILIVVGGAQESLNARPGEMDLTLMNRKGFVRVAMRTGYVALLTQRRPRADHWVRRERYLQTGRQP